MAIGFGLRGDRVIGFKGVRIDGLKLGLRVSGFVGSGLPNSATLQLRRVLLGVWFRKQHGRSVWFKMKGFSCPLSGSLWHYSDIRHFFQVFVLSRAWGLVGVGFGKN